VEETLASIEVQLWSPDGHAGNIPPDPEHIKRVHAALPHLQLTALMVKLLAIAASRTGDIGAFFLHRPIYPPTPIRCASQFMSGAVGKVSAQAISAGEHIWRSTAISSTPTLA